MKVEAEATLKLRGALEVGGDDRNTIMGGNALRISNKAVAFAPGAMGQGLQLNGKDVLRFERGGSLGVSVSLCDMHARLKENRRAYLGQT